MCRKPERCKNFLIFSEPLLHKSYGKRQGFKSGGACVKKIPALASAGITVYDGKIRKISRGKITNLYYTTITNKINLIKAKFDLPRQ